MNNILYKFSVRNITLTRLTSGQYLFSTSQVRTINVIISIYNVLNSNFNFALNKKESKG
jgi:hypothetical protein